MYIGQIIAATCWLDLFNSVPVIITLDSRRSINSPPLRLCPLPRLSALCLQGVGSVSHDKLKSLSCAWVPVMSVRLFSFISLSLCPSPSVYHLSISLSVRLSVRPSVCPSLSVRPSVICSSLCSPCSSRSLSHVLVDHCNLSYNCLSL